MKSLIVATAGLGVMLAFAAPAVAQVSPGPTVCKIAALSEADNWEPMVAMMDIVLENPDQTTEQRANAEAHRAEAVVMRDAARELAARFEGAPDPNPSEIEQLRAISEDDFYTLLDACDGMEDSAIAAEIQYARVIANNAEAIRNAEAALAYVEGSIPFSTTIRDDYASRVNCSVAFEVRAEDIRALNGGRTPSSAVYQLLMQWSGQLVDQLEGHTGDARKVSSDRLGVYPEWNDLYHDGSGYSAASDACERVIMGSDGPRSIPAVNSAPLAASAAPANAQPIVAPPRPVSLFTETYWMGDEVYYRFNPHIPYMFMGHARYGADGKPQAMLLQLLEPREGSTAMIAHHYAVDCQAGTIWWLEQRRLDSGGAILGVTPHPTFTPIKPSNDLGHAIFNATCQMGFTEGEARTAGGWRELHP